MVSESGSCAGFLPTNADPEKCQNCTATKDSHNSAFISPLMGVAHNSSNSTKNISTVLAKEILEQQKAAEEILEISAESEEEMIVGSSDSILSTSQSPPTPTRPSRSRSRDVKGEQVEPKSVPPPRPKAPPNLNYKKSKSSPAKVTQQQPKLLKASAAKSDGSKRRAVSPAPQRPTRTPSHRAKYLSHRTGTSQLLPDKATKLQTVISEASPKPSAEQTQHANDSTPTSTRRSRSNSRGRKKRRAPTPVRKPVDDSESTSNDENVRTKVETAEIERMLKTRLTAINAQLHYIDNKVQTTDKTSKDKENEVDDSLECSDESENSAENVHRVHFDLDVCIINDYIDNYSQESDSETEEDHADFPCESGDDSDENEDVLCVVNTLEESREAGEDKSLTDSSTLTEDCDVSECVSEPAGETNHEEDAVNADTPVREPDRASRARERYRKKEHAPSPPGLVAPPIQNIALRLDSRNYTYNMKKIGSKEELNSEPPPRTSRSKSVDRSFDKPHRKMPPAKNFFKTLLRKGKSKQDVSATEFEVVTPAEVGDRGIEDEEEHEVEGKLPKEFLDTWVSSTTNQLMDEMDQALKGVWPYDKKEDTSSYRRKSSGHEDIKSHVDESQTTMKRKSKLQVPSSGWSDRASVDASSSNFILKEKTKKTTGNGSSGTMRSLRSQYTSQPALHSQTLQRPSTSKDRRGSKDLTLTELDGSVPKTKFREQFLQKMQREGQLHSGKENKDRRSAPSPDATGSSGTLLKKKGKSADSSKGSWDNKSQVSSILKNGSGNNTPNGTISKSKKTTPVVSHGRQSSVPSSTYSGSSSGQSGEFRSKDDIVEGKISPSNSNPHDSGYESGTVRSRKEILALVHHQPAFDSATLRTKKETTSKDSAYDSGTMKLKKEMASNADFATLKRVKRSPTLSLTSRSTPRSAASAIDSIPLCFEQLTSMNVSTLQQLCANYTQSQKPLTAPATLKWHDIGLIDELQPSFSSNKLVLYKGYWRSNPSETFTVMLSLREPAKMHAFKSNLMRTNISFEANVPPHLIPSSLYTGKKLMKSMAQPEPPKPVETKRPSPVHLRNKSTPAFNTQMSVDDSLLTTSAQPAQTKGRLELPSLKSQESAVGSEATGTTRDSVFTNVTSQDSVTSMASIQEQAAVDSILQAVAGEDDVHIPDVPKEPSPSTVRHEPVKLTSKVVEPFASTVKAPVAERFTTNRTVNLFNANNTSSNSTNNNTKRGNFDKTLSGLNSSGLVKNRIANLNNNNSNNCDVDSDEEFDLELLNSNNNNNFDDMLPPGAEADFSFASHLLEMAGGDTHPQGDRVDAVDSTPSPTPRGAVGLSLCEDKVSTAQNVTCYVTLLPTMPRVESIKSFLDRLKSEERTKEDLEMDVIFILLQILNIVFGLHENQLRLDSISMSDFLVVTDEADVSTVHCHMINVTQAPNQKIGLTCEKLRMFLMQVSHSTESLQKSVIFTTVDDMIQNAEDLGDLKTICAILQYLLWGPKEDEVKVITLAEHRRQAFELWLQLARGKLVSSLALKPIDNLKAHMVTNFLANTNGSELFKITKLLNTY